jgi:hypothetical protein
MMTAKIKSKSKIVATKSKMDVAKIAAASTKSQEILNRKTFFEQALINLNNNPFRIVLL